MDVILVSTRAADQFPDDGWTVFWGAGQGVAGRVQLLPGIEVHNPLSSTDLCGPTNRAWTFLCTA
jgi:hypothetical protein